MLMNLLRFFQCFSKPPPPPPAKSKEELLIDAQKELFVAIPNEAASNTGIESEFYDSAKYNASMNDAKNAIEIRWRSNIMHSTKYGSVFMHYDAYKQGFSYYSDKNVPQKVLSAIAVDYVIRYKCRDFFMDEGYYPENVKNPLMDMYFPVEEKQKVARLTGGPFIKRNAASQNKKNESEKGKKGPKKSKKALAAEKEAEEKRKEEQERAKKEARMRKNKFIYMGIIRNMELLKKPPRTVRIETNINFSGGWNEFKKKHSTASSPPSSSSSA